MEKELVKKNCNKEAKGTKALAIQKRKIPVVILPVLLIRWGSVSAEVNRNITVKCLPEQLSILKIFKIHFTSN